MFYFILRNEYKYTESHIKEDAAFIYAISLIFLKKTKLLRIEIKETEHNLI